MFEVENGAIIETTQLQQNNTPKYGDRKGHELNINFQRAPRVLELNLYLDDGASSES